ncbi:MAG: hypothetical protein KatS3mg032_0738 [Cyclobacteriaceae bacterium]|nr:MAG: hypothetical protein KatS3mg032_0738 [Cyclobacteriaceae bacterium]
MKPIKSLLNLLLVASLITGFYSCSKDEDPETLPPTLSFTGGNNATAERGQSVEIVLNLTAQGKIQSLTANGVAVSGITVGAVTQQITFNFTVPVTANLGPLAIEFVLEDQQGRTATATFTINVIGSTIEVTNDITTNTTWEEGNVYILNNTIKVENATLTVEKGVTIQAVDDGKPVQDPTKSIVALYIEPSGKLIAEGEPNKPIVFTVNASSPMPGMWRGIVMKGDPLSANHNAGSLKYVRIEYGGGDESNPASDKGALTIVNAGMSTKVDYVQVFKSLGEGFRIEGSTIALTNCISTENIKSNLNIRHTGTSGEGNVVHTNLYLQRFISHNSTVNKDSRDILMSNPPSGFNGNTLTAANVTLLGPGVSFTAPDGSPSTADGMRAESRSGKVLIYNTIVAEFPEDGIRLSNNVPESRIEYSYFFKIGGTDPTGIPSLGNSTALRENAVQFADPSYNNNINPTTTIIAGIGVNDFTPNTVQTSTFNPTTLNDAIFTFQAFQYVGAIGTSDWTTGGWAKNADGTIRN